MQDTTKKANCRRDIDGQDNDGRNASKEPTKELV